MKKQVKEYIESISWSDWDSETFWSFRAYINNLNVPDEATLDFDYDGSSIDVIFKREETDLEYESRIKAEDFHQQSLEEREKSEYLRLKQKYEK